MFTPLNAYRTPHIYVCIYKLQYNILLFQIIFIHTHSRLFHLLQVNYIYYSNIRTIIEVHI